MLALATAGRRLADLFAGAVGWPVARCTSTSSAETPDADLGDAPRAVFTVFTPRVAQRHLSAIIRLVLDPRGWTTYVLPPETGEPSGVLTRSDDERASIR